MESTHRLAIRVRAALSCWYSKDYDLAIATYEEILELEPNNTSALLDLRELYSELGQKGKMDEIFQRLFDINPDLVDAKKVDAKKKETKNNVL